MRIGLITTLDTNFGDDLVREGICLVLSKIFEGQDIKFIPVNKHDPLTVYPQWHPLRVTRWLARRFPYGRDRLDRFGQELFRHLHFTLFDKCDLIVQCGAPVVWPRCSQCEWAEPLWHQVVGRLSQKGTPVLNLGAGSCYPWERQPQQVDDEIDALYLKRILGYCRITTVRDRLAEQLFQGLGESCAFIPCSALLAGKCFTRGTDKKDLLIVNYMEKGGHYDWEQGISPSEWRTVMATLIDRFRRRHDILFLCHDQREYELAFTLDSTIPRFLAKNFREYFSVLSQARLALCNRLHAVVALAGIGIPSVAVGTDTRLLMIQALGLPFFYVKEATVEKIETAMEALLQNLEIEQQRLLSLREKTWLEYLNAVETTLYSTPSTS